MARFEFEWDYAKARSNVAKHGVTFDEAMSCFVDRFAVETFDVRHSTEEDRFILIGLSALNRLVVVAYTARSEIMIRIISARLATRKESQQYEKQARRP